MAQTRPETGALAGKTPPIPQGAPLLGNLRQAQRDPLGFFLRSARTYGDVVGYRFLNKTSYLVAHPEGVKRVLQENQHNYGKHGTDYDVLRWVLGNGLLTSTGDFWLRQRRLMQPAFHRQRIAAFGAVMTTQTLAMLELWQPAVEHGRPLDVTQEMMQLTLDIVGRALFGLDLSGTALEFGRAFSTANAYVSDRFYFPFPPPGLPTPRNRRFKAALRTLYSTVDSIIQQRRRENADTGDLLSLLLAVRDEETGEGMDDRQLRDEVLTLLLAGHETTANALSWSWHLLGQHPEVERRLHTELSSVLGGRIPTVEDLPKLQYTRMVLDEVMRLYPPAWALSRLTVAEDQICGFRIPANAEVIVSQYVTHRHPDFWENPDVFDPERFAPGQNSDRHRFAYFPFGGGPRLCIGVGFALMEAQLILATVAQRYRLRLASGQLVAPQPLITLRPRHGLPMTLHPV